MALSKAEKEEVFNEYGIKSGDTGSTQVQVAMLTRRINGLIQHMNANKHDQHTRHGLLRMVGRRRRLLAYLRRTDPEAYQNLIARLGLRR